VTFIGREEVSSPAQYRARYRHPTKPTDNSGITIGIGYDLKHVTDAQFRADWSDILAAPVLTRLLPAVNVPGSQELLATVRDVDVPLPGAVTVFLKRMVPRHAGNARSIYPTLDALPPARRTALISLVFNRGTDLEGDRRREMKRIRDLLAAGDTEAVAEQLEAMTRIWDPVAEAGVITRRRREATLWRAGFGALQLA
jgi:hypothetical protein